MSRTSIALCVSSLAVAACHASAREAPSPLCPIAVSPPPPPPAPSAPSRDPDAPREDAPAIDPWLVVVGPEGRTRTPAAAEDADARAKDRPRLRPSPCHDAYPKHALRASPESAMEVLWESLHLACPDLPAFKALVRASGKEGPSTAGLYWLARSPGFPRMLADARLAGCEPFRGTAAQYPFERGCEMPNAWRARGLTEANLCLYDDDYQALLLLWTYMGGSPQAEDALVDVARLASRNRWKTMREEDRRFCTP
jgi:hypothetical protein